MPWPSVVGTHCSDVFSGLDPAGEVRYRSEVPDDGAIPAIVGKPSDHALQRTLTGVRCPVCQAEDPASALTIKVRGWSGGAGSSPALLFLGADSGSFSALGGEEIGVSCVGVAPGQVGVESTGEHDMVGVVGVIQHELA